MLVVLIGFLCFTISSISVVAYPVSYEQVCGSYFSVDLKIKEETNFKVIENDLANYCQNGQDLVDYRNEGIGVETVAAKGGKELFNFSTKAAEHMANPGRAVPVQILEQAIKGPLLPRYRAISSRG